MRNGVCPEKKQLARSENRFTSRNWILGRLWFSQVSYTGSLWQRICRVSRLTDVTNVARFSKPSTPWLSIWRCLLIQAPGRLCVACAAKAFGCPVHCVATRLFIHRISHISVTSARKPSTGPPLWRRMSERTAKLRNSPATYAAKASTKKAIYEIIPWSTRARSRTSVHYAKRRSTNCRI